VSAIKIPIPQIGLWYAGIECRTCGHWEHMRIDKTKGESPRLGWSSKGTLLDFESKCPNGHRHTYGERDAKSRQYWGESRGVWITRDEPS
jgi:hypothetical protein